MIFFILVTHVLALKGSQAPNRSMDYLLGQPSVIADCDRVKPPVFHYSEILAFSSIVYDKFQI